MQSNHIYQKRILALKVGLLFFIAYFISNNFYLGDVFIVPQTFIDKYVKFSPSWIWVYLLSYPLFPFTFFNLKKKHVLGLYVKSFVMLIIVSCSIFIIFPTGIVRDSYDFVSNGYILNLAYKILHFLDKPTNCLPSLHVSTAFLSSFVFYKEGYFKGTLALIFAFMITYSTLAVKQHVFFDAVSGLLCALICFMVTSFYSKKRP